MLNIIYSLIFKKSPWSYVDDARGTTVFKISNKGKEFFLKVLLVQVSVLFEANTVKTQENGLFLGDPFYI